MTGDVDAVNMYRRTVPTTASPPYHHGNLRAALIDAGLALAREGGPDAIVVREASRRLGVSHNAAYRHFPDRGALLEEVAGRCMGELAALMQRMLDQVAPAGRPPEVARARLQAVGMAYVHFALAEPGWFRTAFSSGRSAAAGPAAEPAQAPDASPAAGPAPTPDAPRGPYELLGDQLDGLVTAGVMDPARRPGAETTAWAGVHGLSCLLLDGPLRVLADGEREEALQRLVLDLTAGLTASRSTGEAVGEVSAAARTKAR
jgi:AcrR family transcriptional regulator